MLHHHPSHSHLQETATGLCIMAVKRQRLPLEIQQRSVDLSPSLQAGEEPSEMGRGSPSGWGTALSS